MEPVVQSLYVKGYTNQQGQFSFRVKDPALNIGRWKVKLNELVYVLSAKPEQAIVSFAVDFKSVNQVSTFEKLKRNGALLPGEWEVLPVKFAHTIFDPKQLVYRIADVGKEWIDFTDPPQKLTITIRNEQLNTPVIGIQFFAQFFVARVQ